MIDNKKGAIARNYLIVILVAIIGGVIVLVFTATFAGGVQTGFGESMCTMTSSIRGHTVNVGKFEQHLFPELCETKTVYIEPTKSVGCPSVGRDFDEDEIADIPKTPENCAAEQIINLAARCWAMRGKGGYEPGDFDCYFACLEPVYQKSGEEVSVSEYLEAGSPSGYTEYKLELDNSHLLTILDDAVAIEKRGGDIGYSNVIAASDIDGFSEIKLTSGKFLKIVYVDEEGNLGESEDRIKISETDVRCVFDQGFNSGSELLPSGGLIGGSG